MQTRNYGKCHQLFFSSVQPSKMNLRVVKLAEYPQYLDEAAHWAAERWNYRFDPNHFEKEKKIFEKYRDKFYIVTYGEKQEAVGMFGLGNFDDMSWTHKIKNVTLLGYVYVEEKLRHLGVGKFIVNEAKKIAPNSSTDILYFLTFHPGLNNFYKKLGAIEVSEKKSMKQPVSVLRF